MFRMNRDMRRMLEKMGIEIEELQNVKEVIIRTDKEEYFIKKPTVNLVKMQGTLSFEIMGGEFTKNQLEIKEAPLEIKEDDVLLVARETGVSKEVAEKVLRESNGDIALAILKIQEMKSNNA
ncbi:MAG: nascent polypeptide-associated complex protein [Nitrososphaeria archaeon]|jgi:nascent polypeptide-associated complex subunit alpha